MTTERHRRRATGWMTVVVLLAIAVSACSDDDDSASADPEVRGTLTRITDPPGTDGPVIGTDMLGNVAMVIDAATYCEGYEQFQAFREGYLEQLDAATDLDTVEDWVAANYSSGETGATSMQQGLGVNAGDVGMLPWTFVVNSDEWFHGDYDLDQMRQMATDTSSALTGFDEAAAEVC
jgi:hypothetical protein